MAVPFDLSKTPTRVLTSTGLVAAGAAATALCPPGLGVSLAAILGGIGQSILASDIDRQLQARLNARDILRNTDLQRLAGRAIRLVIEAAVDEEPARFPRQKSAIRKLARKIPEQWVLILQSPSWRVGLEQADVGHVPGLLASYDEGVRQAETLDSDIWLAALQAMADEIKPRRVTDESLEVLAGRLQRQYAAAVQGLLTKDQPAFAALQMIFFKTILDRLPEASAVPASGDSVEPQAVLDTLKKLHDRSLQVQREWLKKLDKAARQRHGELLHSTERSLSALGDSVDALQAGIQQLLDGQVKLQNVTDETHVVAARVGESAVLAESEFLRPYGEVDGT
jgi:predicted translin family RNA/ssDNA-binding protein